MLVMRPLMGADSTMGRLAVSLDSEFVSCRTSKWRLLAITTSCILLKLVLCVVLCCVVYV